MADYITDLTKSPIENLVGLVNAQNNFGYTVAELAVRNLAAVVPPEGHTYNTTVELDPLTNEVDGDYVAFHYRRMDLDTLFSQVTPAIHQALVPLDETGVPASAEGFYAEVLRKYGVNMNTTDFTFVKKSAGVITVSATDSNVAYIGSVDFAINSSLAARVATVKLSGFSLAA